MSSRVLVRSSPAVSTVQAFASAFPRSHARLIMSCARERWPKSLRSRSFRSQRMYSSRSRVLWIAAYVEPGFFTLSRQNRRVPSRSSRSACAAARLVLRSLMVWSSLRRQGGVTAAGGRPGAPAGRVRRLVVVPAQQGVVHRQEKGGHRGQRDAVVELDNV